MPNVPGLRSPYAKVGRIVYFGRLLDKIRLHAAGTLPAEYQGNLGEVRPTLFDARCCRFVGVGYEDLRRRTLEGGTDDEILAWCQASGPKRSDEDCAIWNAYMIKIGWRDDRSDLVRQRAAESGMTGKTVETMFDYIDFDEGRDPVADRSWDTI